MNIQSQDLVADLTKVSLLRDVARAVETYVPDMSTTVGRLKHLRHVVERIPPARFNMGSIMRKSECGTVGCMIGWAALDPVFVQDGLSLRKFGTASHIVEFRGDVTGGYGSAGAGICGITVEDAKYLFTEDAHEGEPYFTDFTVAHGLARIDRMIEKYSA